MTFIESKNGNCIAGAFEGAGELTTPQVVVDVARLRGNIASMRRMLPSTVELHPHVKTHKSFRIAELQRREGAAGFTASRAPEALKFIRGGFGPVTVAFPIVDGGQAEALIRAALEAGTEVRFIADSGYGVDLLEAASARLGGKVAVFLKVDVGLHRCGVDPHGTGAHELARRIAAARHLGLAGLLSHAGHAYAAGTPDRIRLIAAQERELLLSLRERLRADGIDAPRLSIGSTPTVFANAGFDGVEEVRPGNYVFLDLAAAGLGIARRNDISLAVVASVVSARGEQAIIDAGSKTLSSDLGPHGSRIASGYGEAYSLDGRHGPFRITRLSEEHGFVSVDEGAVEIGSKLIVLPNHACTVNNLASSICFLEDGKKETVPVDARN